MKKVQTFCAIVGVLLCGAANAGMDTVAAVPGQLSYATTTQTITILAKGGAYWTNSCSIVQIRMSATFPGVKELLSIVLTAKATGSAVSFFGDCDASTGYFSAHSVSLP